MEKYVVLGFLVLNTFRTYVVFRFLRLYLGAYDRGIPGRRGLALLYFAATSYCYLLCEVPLLTFLVNGGGLFAVSFIRVG